MGLLSGHRRNRGVAVVLVVGVIAVFLIFFFIVGIDFAYIYSVRGEMQNAADAASLAGAAVLTDPNDLNQFAAREKAIEFALNNIAALANVVLISNTPDAFSPGDNLIHDDNDVTVGYYDDATGVYTPGITPVNAMQVRPRRTDETPATGGEVELFFGRIIGRPTMEVSTTATAAQLPPRLLPIPVCLPTCDLETPLDGKWGYDKNEPEPILCTDEPTGGPLDPPGQKMFLAASSQDDAVPQPGIAWTNFAIDDCLDKKCDMPNANEVEPYLRGTKTPPAICGKDICTTNGTIHPLIVTLKEEFDKNKTIVTVDGRDVVGWRVLVPVVSNLSCGDPKQSCPGAQAGAANPYRVEGLTEVLITEVMTSGKSGFRMLGLQTPAVEKTYDITCKKGPVTFTRKVTTIGGPICNDCTLPPPTGGGSTARLVK